MTRLCVLYFALATACLVWPIYPWLGNRIEPRVFGLPFSLTWILGVIAANFVVLLVLYRLRLIDAQELEDAAPSKAPAEAPATPSGARTP